MREHNKTFGSALKYPVDGWDCAFDSFEVNYLVVFDRHVEVSTKKNLRLRSQVGLEVLQISLR